MHTSTLQLRPYAGESDLSPLVEMFNHAAAVVPGENATSIDELRADIARPGIDLMRHVVIVQHDAKPVGFAAIIRVCKADKHEGHLWLRSAPEFAADVEPMLIDWFLRQGEQMAAESGLPAELLNLAGEEASARHAALKARGFEAVRYFFRMARPLADPISPSPLPPQYRIRPLKSLDEIDAWVEAYNNSFVDHWHFSPMLVDQAKHFAEHDPNYAREGDLVAIGPDGEIAAFCQCVVRSNENAVTGRREGWIALLGTCRGHRGSGLGRAMLTAGLEWLKKQGMQTAMLGVDASNPTGAFGLYQSVGFAPTHRRTMYSRTIHPTAKK